MPLYRHRIYTSHPGLQLALEQLERAGGDTADYLYTSRNSLGEVKIVFARGGTFGSHKAAIAYVQSLIRALVI